MAFTKDLTMYQIYYTWIHPSLILLYAPPPIPGILSRDIDFVFTFMCTYFLHCIHPSTAFPCQLPLLIDTNPSSPKRPVLPFCSPIFRRKNDILLVWNKSIYTGSFLVICTADEPLGGYSTYVYRWKYHKENLILKFMYQVTEIKNI
jgi:hypothetical protein